MDAIESETQVLARPKRAPLSFRGYLALVLSVVIGAVSWTIMLGANTYFGDGSTTKLPLPGILAEPALWLFEILPIAIPLVIAVDIVGGWRGGRNRIASIVGGVVLFSPLLFVLVDSALSAIFFHD